MASCHYHNRYVTLYCLESKNPFYQSQLAKTCLLQNEIRDTKSTNKRVSRVLLLRVHCLAVVKKEQKERLQSRYVQRINGGDREIFSYVQMLQIQ